MSNKFEVPDFGELRDELLRAAKVIGGKEALDFFHDSFVKEGFTDTSFQAWPKSKNPFRHGNKTLYSNSTLSRSLRKEESGNRITIRSISKYAEIHNEGGFITVTKAMKAHFWKLYYELEGAKPKSKGATKARISAKADLCKRIALMK